ncbi:uncharacterized protein E0L32_007870 [Thyridium curvatum]|uniref:Uncharacterized protein n=1 Tax=Thyridium curvatum TaxID=1093900 RepID=A0A507B303_9PEZI|nr:uncharacterized protein E0L32_007870 [Thyridium curvatum]TPX11451.1 hypothetical protein E0L32_007870 [Thyridium curvatum]
MSDPRPPPPGTLAEALSLAGSIADTVSNLADYSTPSAAEMRLFAVEMRLLACSLHCVDTIRPPRGDDDTAPELKTQVENMYKMCATILEHLKDLQDALRPLAEQFRTPSLLSRVFPRLEWFFADKRKVLVHRKALNAQRVMLNIYTAMVFVRLEDR